MKHKKHRQIHAFRLVLLGMLLIAVSAVRIDASSLPSLTKPEVLAYASNMSRGDLISATNASRASSGLPPLNLNGQLNNSAQAKAQHMADHNYWSHVAPDGTQPWYFFGASGYSYASAGENLAYGFDSGYAVNQGWMNSATHRANILGDYVDVGFGIVNAPGFQGSEQTIVVAHYAKPIYSPPPPPPPAVTAVEPPPSQPQPAPASQPSSAEQAPQAEQPAQAEESEQSAEETQALTEVLTQEDNLPTAPIAVGSVHPVSVFEQIVGGTTPVVAMIGLILALVAGAGFAFAHRPIVRHALTTGQHSMLAHPTLDAVALAIALTLILTTTAAYLH